MTALARADGVPVGLPPHEPVPFLEPRDDLPVGRLLVEALEALGDHPAVGPDHGERLEPVVAADLEVDRVVARGDLEGAGAELGLDPLRRR